MDLISYSQIGIRCIPILVAQQISQTAHVLTLRVLQAYTSNATVFIVFQQETRSTQYLREDKRGRAQKCQRKYARLLESLSVLDSVDVVSP